MQEFWEKKKKRATQLGTANIRAPERAVKYPGYSEHDAVLHWVHHLLAKYLVCSVF